MKTKICTKCNIEKDISEFSKHRIMKDGLQYYCKSCIKICAKENKKQIAEYQKEYRKINKIKISKQRKKYRDENKSKIFIQKKKYRENNKEHIREHLKKYFKENKEKTKIYQEKNKKKILERRKIYQNFKYKNDINFKIKHNLRTRIGKVLKGINKSKRTLELLGCSVEFLKFYFQSKFKKGMTWRKFLEGKIHIDHIKPCSKF